MSGVYFPVQPETDKNVAARCNKTLSYARNRGNRGRLQRQSSSLYLFKSIFDAATCFRCSQHPPVVMLSNEYIEWDTTRAGGDLHPYPRCMLKWIFTKHNVQTYGTTYFRSYEILQSTHFFKHFIALTSWKFVALYRNFCSISTLRPILNFTQIYFVIL